MHPIPARVTTRKTGCMTWLVVVVAVWLLCASFASRPRGDRWRIRLYAVTLVPLTALVLVGVLFVVQTVAEGSSAAALADTVPYAQWLALATNFVVADIVLQRHPLARSREGERTAYRFMSHSPSQRHPVLARD